jgi:hypothetical protein
MECFQKNIECSNIYFDTSVKPFDRFSQLIECLVKSIDCLPKQIECLVKSIDCLPKKIECLAKRIECFWKRIECFGKRIESFRKNIDRQAASPKPCYIYYIIFLQTGGFSEARVSININCF